MLGSSYASLFDEAKRFYRETRRPGEGRVSDACDLSVGADGRTVLFTGHVLGDIESSPVTRICALDLLDGKLRTLTDGPGHDRLPKFAPSVELAAFLSDRTRAGDVQLYFLDTKDGTARPAPTVDGWIEYFHWSPKGDKILIAAAGHGADKPTALGATVTAVPDDGRPSWMPLIETGDEQHRWRSLWVLDLSKNEVARISPFDLNIWEANWLGNDTVAAVASRDPREGGWYDAGLALLDVTTKSVRNIYAPKDQIGLPTGSPNGDRLAIVEAVCSDRWYVAGSLEIWSDGKARLDVVDTAGVDVTCVVWLSDDRLLLAGHRGLETVVATYDCNEERFAEEWSSQLQTTGGAYAQVTALGGEGSFLLVAEAFNQAPEIAVVEDGEYSKLHSFCHGYAAFAEAIGGILPLEWEASDGLTIQGWLLSPVQSGPRPLITYVHGGPVWHWRPRWLGRGSAQILMLLKRGYAIFFPNPRGSSGRGQEFARAVIGDMGGKDMDDLLTGLDHLVRMGLADEDRVGVTGVSYGGFMSSWLITQSDKISAAVPVSPTTNFVSQQFMSNIPDWVRLFVGDEYYNVGGYYYQRSPLLHAYKAHTPTLNICGALDRCTPPAESIQFHNALLLHGVKSHLVCYPGEGHGVRNYPASFDYAARLVDWFETHLCDSREDRLGTDRARPIIGRP